MGTEYLGDGNGVPLKGVTVHADGFKNTAARIIASQLGKEEILVRTGRPVQGHYIFNRISEESVHFQ